MNWEVIITNMTMFGFPISHLMQLQKVISTNDTEDLSIWTFILFIVANMSAFIYTTKGFNTPNIMNFIIPSIIEGVLVYYIMKRDKYDDINRFLSMVFCIVVIIFGCIAVLYKFPRITKYSGWIPAVVMPISIIMELISLYQKKKPNEKTDKSTLISWVLILIALIGSYILAGRYGSIESISSFLIPSILSIWIVIKVYDEYVKSNYKKK